MSTARYYTKDMHSIEGVGVEPDIEVLNSDLITYFESGLLDKDTQLSVALKLFNN